MELSKQEIKKLKGIAHHNKALFNIGKESITDSVIAGIKDALSARELIKVKFLESSKLDSKDGGVELARKVDAQLVGTIGFVAILYKKSEKAKTHILDQQE